MTPEMVELEFAHIALDRELSGENREQYSDDEYESYDEDSEKLDSKLSGDMLPDYTPSLRTPSKTVENDDDGWEDVEEGNTE